MPTDEMTCRDCAAAMPIGSSELRCPACSAKRERLLGQLGNAVDRHASRRSRESGGFSGSQSQRAQSASHFMASGRVSDETCSNCRERNAQVGSPYCLMCRLALHKSLGDAAKSTKERQTRKRKKPEDRMRTTSVKNALAEKRRRTGMHRFNPAPQLSKRYR